LSWNEKLSQKSALHEQTTYPSSPPSKWTQADMKKPPNPTSSQPTGPTSERADKKFQKY